MNNPLSRELLDNPPDAPCFFELYRFTDEHGISSRYADSDNGKVMEGIVTTDGKVIVRWLSKFPSVVVFESWRAFVFVHVHPHTRNETLIKFHMPGLVPTRTWPQPREEQLVDDLMDLVVMPLAIEALAKKREPRESE